MPSTVVVPKPPVYERVHYREILAVAVETFRSNKVRFALTALGMVIGTASLILVVTIGLTGKQYILREINAIGANMITANYEGGTIYGNSTSNDFMTLDDMNAIRAQVPGIVAASPMIQLHDQVPVPGGLERDVLILGVSSEYQYVRNLIMPAGRFFDEYDSQSRNKVALITKPLAVRLFGSEDAAVGQPIKLNGLPFTIIGTFRERVETFGQSEITEDTILIPYTVARYFTDTDAVKNLFFSMSDSERVPAATKEIQAVLQSRHRPESVYKVENLTQLLDVAAKTANALTAVLLLISAVTLVVSGVGIMNIMLSTVSARIREIGVRKAVGATNSEIRLQFLTEAVLISLVGGFIGIVAGLALPVSLRFFTDYRVPISGLSVIIALVVSSMVGVLFGTVPATRAAQLDPVESLRYE
jgi:putative ABC transport system permease protein